LQTDRWIQTHNAEVEEKEWIQKEAEELERLAEKKRLEIEEDRRWREKGKGRVVGDMLGLGLSQSWKWRAVLEEEGPSSKRLKVSNSRS